MINTTLLVQCDSILIIKQRFYEFLFANGIVNTAEVEVSALRRLMFEFFSQDLFLTNYKKLALSIATAAGFQEQDFIVQRTPTPRIFRHGAHGTSYHCDYWYGHGERSSTAWVALSEIDFENTFLICQSAHNDYMYKKLIAGGSFVDIDAEDNKYFYPVAPQRNEAVLFSAKAIHGSPLNRSLRERISFDFRIGSRDDTTSTKNINSYYSVINGEFITQNIFDGFRFLRYVCGGENRDTFSQHLVIDSAAKALSLNIVGQEAEIERLGYPMLSEILTAINLGKKFNAIIIASESILSQELRTLSNTSAIKVYAVLENRFL